MIERTFGSVKLLMLYVVASVITGYVQNYVSGPAFFGLSGVVYAVLGYVFIRDKLNHHLFDLPEGFFHNVIGGDRIRFY